MTFHHSNHTIATAILAFAYYPEDGTIRINYTRRRIHA